MEKPLISFILTYYNLPVKMLCECIDSIMALSLRPVERVISSAVLMKSKM